MIPKITLAAGCPKDFIRNSGKERTWQAGWLGLHAEGTTKNAKVTKCRGGREGKIESNDFILFVPFVCWLALPLLGIRYGVVLPHLLHLHHLGEHSRSVVMVPLQNLG
ncbi:MAG: hypothetical protein WAL87_04725 [Chthoniobacterales bacterium]